MINNSKHNELKGFLAKHHLYVKSDFNKFAWYTFFSPMEPLNLLFLLYLHHLFDSYAIAGLLISLKMILSAFLQVLFSGVKDRAELKYTLAVAEFSACVSYLFFVIAPFFDANMMAVLCVGICFSAIAKALWDGTYNAFIYENFEKDHPELGTKPYSKLQSVFYLGKSAEMIISATLAGSLGFGWALSFGMITNLTASIIALCLKGPKRMPKMEDEISSKHQVGILHFIESTKHMFQNDKLRYISIAEIVRMSLVETYHRFTIPFYKTFMPLSTLGYVETVRQILGSTSFFFSQGIIKKFGFIKCIKGFFVIRFVLFIVGLMLNSVLTPVFFIFRTLFYGPMITCVEYTMQKHYSEKERVSMSASLRMLSMPVAALFMYVLGLIADIFSLQMALAFLLPFYFIPYILYRKTFQILGKE